MPEKYDPTLNGYRRIANNTIELSSTEITEEEINAALEDLYNG